MNKLVPFGVALATAAFISFTSHAAVTTVESGQTLTVTDATVGDYADGFQFADETGVIEFDTTAAPTMDITGAGTVKKTSSADWTMSKQVKGFTGDYILQGGGVVTVPSATEWLFGNDEQNKCGDLVVESGNTLYIPNTGIWNNLFVWRRVVIAGDGVNGRGAIDTGYAFANASHYMNLLQLSDDATIRLGNTQFFGNGSLDPNGHTLTIAGGNGDFQVATGYWNRYLVKSNGVIRVRGESASKPARFTIRNAYCEMEPSEDSPFLLDDFALLNPWYYDGTYNICSTNDRPIWVKGTNARLAVLHQNVDQDEDWKSTDRDRWTGDIVFKESGSILTVSSSLRHHQLNLLGDISGDGSLVVGNSGTGSHNSHRGRLFLAGTNNTYTGSTYVNNYFGTFKWGAFLAAGPHSIPDYSKLTGNYGFVSVRLKERESDDELLWTDGTFIRDLANEGTWLNGCAVGLDTTYCNGPFTMAMPTGITNATAFVGGSGPGEVIFTNVVGTAENPIRLHQGGGLLTVKTKPGEKQVVGEIRVSPAVGVMTNSVVCFEDCDLVMPPTGKFVGKYRSSDDGLESVIRLKNTRLVASTLTNDWNKSYATDVIYPGGPEAGCGTLEIYDGSVVTGRIVASGTVYGGHGAIYQYGGSVTALGRKGTEVQYGSQISGCNMSSGDNNGYYELRGGEFVAAGTFGVGYVEGGLWTQYGGSFRMTNALDCTDEPCFCLCTGNGQAWATGLRVAGGTWDIGNGRVTVNGGYSANHEHALVTVEGEGTFVNFGTRYIWPNNIATAQTRFTLASGGRLRLPGLRRAHGDSELSVNFNGGIWECSCNDAISAGDIFHSYRTSWANGMSRVFVYSGGATIDTAGKTGNGTYQVIHGAFGGGITGLKDFTPVKVGPFEPVVRIYGDGEGAVAVAVWDRETGMVSGIRVIAPGVGYTQATAGFCYGRSGDPAAANIAECTIAENVNTGSFTKAGAGEFFLAATNTWGGATIVKGGSLKAKCDWAIPTNTAVRLEGGNLDLNGKVAKISSVTYGAGGGQILNAENAELPATASIVIDIADLVAGNPVALTGDVDLSTMPITITGDVSLLVEGAKYVLATTADGTFIGKPTYTLEDEPANWGLANRGTRLVYRFVKGALILVR